MKTRKHHRRTAKTFERAMQCNQRTLCGKQLALIQLASSAPCWSCCPYLQQRIIHHGPAFAINPMHRSIQDCSNCITTLCSMATLNPPVSRKSKTRDRLLCMWVFGTEWLGCETCRTTDPNRKHPRGVDLRLRRNCRNRGTLRRPPWLSQAPYVARANERHEWEYGQRQHQVSRLKTL